MARNQRVEAVARFLRVELARELDRAQHAARIAQAGAPEFVPEKSVVEARVVRDEQLAFESRQQLRRDYLKSGRECHHVVRDPGHGLDHRRDSHAGVHERRPFAHEAPALHLDQTHFRDAVVHRVGAGRFNVQENEGLV